MNKDIKTAIFFMISMSTVIEEMTTDLIQSKEMEVNYEKYEDKIHNHKIIYESIYNSFCDSVFGEFANKVKREVFKENLADEGWKYFNSKSLNDIFTEEAKKLTVED